MVRLLFVLLMMLVPAGALAQEGPPAFAAVQAPEAGAGICVERGVDPAITCAMNACMTESGLGPEDCQLNAVCSPAGWSVDIFMQHQEGLHWHTYLCGWQTRAQAEAAAAIACMSEWLTECSIVQVWDPEGTEIALTMGE